MIYMVADRKRTLLKTFVKVLLFLHLFLFPAAVLLWGKGYVALARHLSEGVLYEITAVLNPYHWYMDRLEDIIKGGDNPLFMYKTGVLNIPVNDLTEPGFTDLLIIWGERLEDNFRYLQSPEALDSLVWVEGVELTGNREPTLIAYGTAELDREWQSRETVGAPTFHGTAVVSQRVYNLDRLWLIFYGILDSAGRPVMPYREPVIRRAGVGIVPMDSPAERWIPRARTSVELLERLRTYRPGVMPVGYRLRVALIAQPAESWFPVPRGGWETLFLISGFILVIVTTPYRMPFYLPLLLSPRLLVWPVAVLWAMVWMASWVWCLVAAYRRVQKAFAKDAKKFAKDAGTPGEN
jgi:hypothetical protein